MGGDAGGNGGVGGVDGERVRCSIGIGVLKNHLGEGECGCEVGGDGGADKAAGNGAGLGEAEAKCRRWGDQHYLEWRIMKAICSVVMSSAAQMRSPSFSRSVESRTTMNSPFPAG